MSITFKKANMKDFTGETYQTDLSIYSWGITSLEGMPKIVKGSLDISHNRLTTLKYCPERVEGNFVCTGNKLKTFLGAPKEIYGDLKAGANSFNSMKGFPQVVKGDVYLLMNFALNKNDILSYLDEKNIEIGGIIETEAGNLTEEYRMLVKKKNAGTKLGKFKDFLDL